MEVPDKGLSKGEKMNVRVRRLARLALVAGLISPVMAGTASASHISCGQTITTNTSLDADVGPCAGDGLVVGADNITIDLNGHRLFGTSGLLGANDVGVGVRIVGRSGVVVKNGIISDFDAGVVLDGASDNEVSGLTLRDNIQSELGGGDFGDGVAILGGASDNNSVLNNTIDNNGPFSGISVFLGSSTNKITGTVISGNTVSDNNVSSQTGGIRIENWSWDSTISGNTITGNALEGVALFADTEGNDVLSNTITANGFTSALATHRRGDGIRAFLRANNNLIQSNQVTGNAGYGIIIQGQDNDIVGNTATGNDQAADPNLGRHTDLKDTNANCDNNSWRGNTFGTADPACTTGGFQADVSVTNADSPDPVTAGSDITYTVTVANAGPDSASTVALSDSLSTNTQFRSVSTTQGSCSHSGENKGGTVTCALGSVASGSSATVTVVAKAKEAGVSTSNTASASSTTADPNSANNSATATTTVT
ncbi:MAG: right-handed parallel beta-helix repeat-containing protein [Acidimicrobiales bacterium]